MSVGKFSRVRAVSTDDHDDVSGEESVLECLEYGASAPTPAEEYKRRFDTIGLGGTVADLAHHPLLLPHLPLSQPSETAAAHECVTYFHAVD